MKTKVVSTKARQKIPSRNRSPSGWWIFAEVQYWVQTKPIDGKFSERVDVWENTRILRAKNRDEAYRKAMEFGRVGMPSKTKAGVWKFGGISMLLPIYEKLSDGAEVLWTKRGRMTKAKALALAKRKNDLPVFSDCVCHV
jgi:hypothetical protein